MVNDKWSSVSILTFLSNKIDSLKEKGEIASRGKFVEDAIREKLIRDYPDLLRNDSRETIEEES